MVKASKQKLLLLLGMGLMVGVAHGSLPYAHATCLGLFQAAVSAPPLIAQSTEYTCGPASLQSILLKLTGQSPSELDLARLAQTSPLEGTSPENLTAAARSQGLMARIRENLTIDQLRLALHKGRFWILNIQSLDGEGHWVVLTSIQGRSVVLMDPWMPRAYHVQSIETFLKRWHGGDLLEPTYQLGIELGVAAAEAPSL